jgi:hypothetical protein
MQLESTLTCPACGHETVETMPTDACQFFDCRACGKQLKPRAGDCVFCSFGSVPCPPVQTGGRCSRGCRSAAPRACASQAG